MIPDRRAAPGPGTMTLVSGPPERTYPPTADADQRALAVVFEYDAEEWRRRWSETERWSPDREAYVDVQDTARGTAAAAGGTGQTPASPSDAGFPVIRDGDVGLTPLVRPVSAATIAAAARRYVDGWGEAGYAPTVYVESLAGLLEDDDLEPTVAALRELQRSIAEWNATLVAYCDFDALGDDTLRRLRAPFDSVFEESPATGDDRIRSQLAAFRRADPTKYGYLRQHWREAKRGIEACTRNYPQARQIHAELSEPTTSPRTLGAALGALVELGVIDRWGETVSATRYDLTTYDAERLAEIGQILDEA